MQWLVVGFASCVSLFVVVGLGDLFSLFVCVCMCVCVCVCVCVDVTVADTPIQYLWEK